MKTKKLPLFLIAFFIFSHMQAFDKERTLLPLPSKTVQKQSQSLVCKPTFDEYFQDWSFVNIEKIEFADLTSNTETGEGWNYSIIDYRDDSSRRFILEQVRLTI